MMLSQSLLAQINTHSPSSPNKQSGFQPLLGCISGVICELLAVIFLSKCPIWFYMNNCSGPKWSDYLIFSINSKEKSRLDTILCSRTFFSSFRSLQSSHNQDNPKSSLIFGQLNDFKAATTLH